MSAQSARRHAYLLRAWATDSASQPVEWRFSLQDAESGERLGFANLESLTAWLRERLETESQINEFILNQSIGGEEK